MNMEISRRTAASKFCQITHLNAPSNHVLKATRSHTSEKGQLRAENKVNLSHEKYYHQTTTQKEENIKRTP